MSIVSLSRIKIDKNKVTKVILRGVRQPEAPRFPLEMEIVMMANFWNSFSSSKSPPPGRNKNRPENIDEIIKTLEDAAEKSRARSNFLIEALEDAAQSKANKE